MRPLLLALALVASPAFAGKCTANDSWTGPDKNKHALVGAAVGGSVTLMTKSREKAVIATAIVAGLKEMKDRGDPNHTCSLQDFAVTVAAGTAAAYGVGYVVLPKKDGVEVAVAKRF